MSIEAPNFHYDPDHDVNDHKEWLDMDLFDLKTSIENGSTIEEAAAFLCRSTRWKTLRRRRENSA